MQKVLLLTLEFPPDRGGVARYYGGLVAAMPKDSVIVYRAQLSRWIWPRWLPLLWQVWRVIRREQVTEVWVGHILPLGTIAFLLKKLLVTRYSLPVTLFTHGMDILVPQRSSRKTWLLKRILKVANRVVTISRFTKGELVKLGVAEEKIVIISPCPTLVNHESPHQSFRVGTGQAGIMNQELRKKYNLENKKILLTVARLVERKGIDLVLAALQQLSQTKSRIITDFVYVVVGDGPERENYELRIKNYGFPVLFVGAISDDELSAWYDACDVFIMIPRQIGGDVEGFGLVYLEANSHGKPVIGSRSGGVPDAVADGVSGLLVDEGDVDGTAAAIERLFSDSALRKQLGEQGKARVEREFRWEKQIPLLAGEGRVRF